jgi:hypothetical protein
MYRLQVCMSLLSQTESIHHVAKVLRNNPLLTGTVIFHMYIICRFKRFTWRNINQ